MENWKCILILLMVSITSAQALPEYMINVQISKEKANIGDDVEVTCQVSSDEIDGERNLPLIVWVKRQWDTVVDIGTNNYINDPFKKVGRYMGQVDYEYDDNNEMILSDVSFRLTIKDVKPEDSGEIGCRMPQQNSEVFRPLTVFVPAKSILLSSLDVDGIHAQSYSNETEVTFDEGLVWKFYCHVKGSYPSPTVSIFIGDKDITDQFKKEEKLLKNGVVKGLEELSYDVTLKNEALTIDYSFADKRLECRATLPGSGFPPKTTGINIKLSDYKPKFVCNKTMDVLYLQMYVYIKCYVHAVPEIDQFRIYWGTNMSHILEGNSSEGLYHAYVGNGLSATEKIMTLKIERVFKQHFRTYYFEAGNELGAESHAIELIRDIPPTVNAGVLISVPICCATVLAGLVVLSIYN